MQKKLGSLIIFGLNREPVESHIHNIANTMFIAISLNQQNSLNDLSR